MITLRLLGSVDLQDDGGRDLTALLRQPKRMALLAYLAAATPRGFHSRDELLALFWPELPNHRARHALSQSLHMLRRVLGEEAIVTRGEAEIALNTAIVASDVAAFEGALAREEYALAATHFRGDFLAGLFVSAAADFERWVDGERERLGHSYRMALEHLAEQARHQGDHLSAVSWWRRVSERDPYGTGVCLRLMEALEAAGDRAGALQYAERHGARLREDLGAEPAPDVVALAERLRVRPVARQVVGGELERVRAALTERYAIQRAVGSGGMATVYLAEDLKHHRRVAVKVLKPELAAALGPERFLREIETVAKLNHPHILPLFDSGEADGLLYYVMPYVEGESLRDRLNREQQLAIDDAIRITCEVADALDYAHRRHVVHRDIKPENILLGAGHAHVADFGIARALSAAGGERLTDAGIAVGTAAYMSPEQAAGDGDVDSRSDIYSLGCVLYEMLAGHPPFTGSTAQETLARHRVDAVPSLSAARPTATPGLERAIATALAKTPADRFRTPALFAAALTQPEPVAMTNTRVVSPLRRVGPLVLLGVAGAAAVGILMLRPDRSRNPPAAAAHERTAIAVLPFQNLSAEGPHAYFAGGLYDEILTQLAGVAALKVISRTSVMSYAVPNTPPLRQIASELRVGSIVEGSVQVVDDRLRVNVQLIDATTDEHLWAQRYDRTLDDAFALQSDIARQIVAAIGAALAPTEEQRLADPPTANAEAYRLYLKGREYLFRTGPQRRAYEAAQQLFEQALVLDPDFAVAHAWLSVTHGMIYRNRYDPSPARAARQREEAEIALRLAPDLPESHGALGLAYYDAGDWSAALREYSIALDRQPNSDALRQAITWVYRRLGKWEDAVVGFEKVSELNPRNGGVHFDRGTTLLVMHRYADAVRAFDEALRLQPDHDPSAARKGLAYVLWQGQLDTLRAILRRLPREALETGFAWDARAQLLMWERNPDSLLQFLGLADFDVSERPYSYPPTSLYAAWAHQLRGDQLAAGRAFETALVLLDSVIQELPDDWRGHAARGLALAGLDRRELALDEVRWLQRSAVYRRDAHHGPLVAEACALILAQIGETDTALNEIERLLAKPSWLSVHTLRLDPRWDRIRGHPRFRMLLAKYQS